MRILIDEDIPARELFDPLGEVHTFTGRRLADAPATALAEADALVIRSVTRLDAALIARLPGLGFVGTVTTGTDHVDAAALARRGIAFADAAGANALPVAEYTLAAIAHLASQGVISGRPPATRAEQAAKPHSKAVEHPGPGLPFVGLTLGVIGRGRIGSIVAAWAARLGMAVLACDPPLARQGVAGLVSFEELAAGSEVVSLHVPLIEGGPDATANLADAAWLSRLVPGAALINTSRGCVVDEAALGAALKAGRLSAAVLDVWRNEPDVDARLARAAALATPHLAGYSVESRRRAAETIGAALADWARGRPGSNSPEKPGVSPLSSLGAAAQSEPGRVGPVADGRVGPVADGRVGHVAGSRVEPVADGRVGHVAGSRVEPGVAPLIDSPPPAAARIYTLVNLLSDWSARFKAAAAQGQAAEAFDALRREAQTRREIHADSPR